jgi:hypothetical protein
MASFTKGAPGSIMFGKNVYLRSTVGMKFESYTLAYDTVPTQTIDGVAGQKILQPGTVLAKITNGTNAGKVGPFMAAGTAEIQVLTGGGTISGGTYTITFNGATTTAIAFNAPAATVQAALEALATIGTGNVVVTGGPVSTTPLTLTFQGQRSGDIPQITASAASLTGSSPTLTPSTSTPGVAGAVDGRSVLTNIVGLNDTFLPWQLMERDVEVAAMYIGTAVQGWCLEYNAAGTLVALTNTTADAMRSTKGLDITFK